MINIFLKIKYTILNDSRIREIYLECNIVDAIRQLSQVPIENYISIEVLKFGNIYFFDSQRNDDYENK